jgi:hypothetical protein
MRKEVKNMALIQGRANLRLGRIAVETLKVADKVETNTGTETIITQGAMIGSSITQLVTPLINGGREVKIGATNKSPGATIVRVTLIGCKAKMITETISNTIVTNTLATIKRGTQTTLN